MKKLLITLMTLAMVYSLSISVFAAPADVVVDSSGTSADLNQGDLDYDDDDGDSSVPAPAPAHETRHESTPVEEVKVEVKVNAAVDKSGNAVEVAVVTVTAEALAAEQPAVAAKLEESRTAVAEIKQAATPEVKEAVVTAYFDNQGAEVKAAITAAIAESAEVSSLADIEPVPVAPVKVESAAFAEGGSVTMTIDMPTEFEAYALSENSFVCAELVDADGNVHIVSFKVVDGKLVGDFPTAGVIGSFWVGSSVTAPQTGNTNLEGIVFCGIILCAAVLLFSVKRFKRAYSKHQKY